MSEDSDDTGALALRRASLSPSQPVNGGYAHGIPPSSALARLSRHRAKILGAILTGGR